MSIVPKKYISEDLELMKEWGWEANNKERLDPTQLAWGSNKKLIGVGAKDFCYPTNRFFECIQEAIRIKLAQCC